MIELSPPEPVIRDRPALIHQTPAPSPEMAAGPRLSAAELREQELINAFGNTACRIVDWIRHSSASPASRLRSLEQIADIAAFHHSRMKWEIEEGKP